MTDLLLEARHLVAERDGDSGPCRVLDGVTLSLRRGMLAEVTGPSGAGKTTLLLALARLLPGVTGSLALDGRDAAEIDPAEWRSRVALLPQRPALTRGTVADSLLLPWSFKIRTHSEHPTQAELRSWLDRVGLAEVSLDRDATRLSVGQAARIALLRAVLVGPEVLLLDEPDASLDDESAAEVQRLSAEFASRGGAVVRVSHLRRGGEATVRYRLAAGHLTEVRDA